MSMGPRKRSLARRSQLVVLVAAAASLLGCAHHSVAPVRPAAITHAAPHPHPSVLFSPPLALASPEDAVVRVVGPEMSCSGTLVDDDLVLTAHHCVVKRGAHGEFTREPMDAHDLQIELGGDYLAWGTVRARAIVAPPCGASGGAGDLAILVLERKLVGMSSMAPRLDAPPRMGEPLDPIGFGRCALSPNGIHRADRAGGNVVGTTQETFVVQASICPGDSGGPVVARGSREVVGVVSQSAMDGDERTRSVTILARLDVYRAVFAAARQVADGVDLGELPPLGCAP
jgi:hypothetical protein